MLSHFVHHCFPPSFPTLVRAPCTAPTSLAGAQRLSLHNCIASSLSHRRATHTFARYDSTSRSSPLVSRVERAHLSVHIIGVALRRVLCAPAESVSCSASATTVAYKTHMPPPPSSASAPKHNVSTLFAFSVVNTLSLLCYCNLALLKSISGCSLLNFSNSCIFCCSSLVGKPAAFWRWSYIIFSTMPRVSLSSSSNLLLSGSILLRSTQLCPCTTHGHQFIRSCFSRCMLTVASCRSICQ